MNFSFNSSVEPKQITRELIKENELLTPRRICFSSCHKEALKKENGQYLGKFSIPFKETIKNIFEHETGLTLFLNFGRYWHSIKTGQEGDIEKIEEFIGKYKDVVFLRDCLDLSIALSENLSANDEFTRIGKLEDQAKYKGDNQAISDLAAICNDFILNTSYYSEADFIVAVPPSDPNNDNLPRKVLREMKDFNKKDISNSINWTSTKPQLKELELDKKLIALERVELTIKENIKNKSIIIIDDLYQSGTTMQYIAMKLKEAGAKYVYGISFVKARNDKDYV